MELQKLLERVPIPVKESIEEPSAKVPTNEQLGFKNVPRPFTDFLINIYLQDVASITTYP